MLDSLSAADLPRHIFLFWNSNLSHLHEPVYCFTGRFNEWEEEKIEIEKVEGGRNRSFESSEGKLGFIFRQNSSQRDHEKPLFCVPTLFPKNLEAFVVEFTQ